ncbi:DsbA family protein [Candidatus Pelagibacter sp.]|nr:DsbA family protein [Candidatus Pelagibacter sp.]
MKKIFVKTTIILLFFTSFNLKAEIKPIIEGGADAKVKLVVFESLTCSHCADFHKNVYPSLKTDFIDNGLISIEFRNFPLDIAAFNASKIAHCRNDGKSEILHHLYNNQSSWVRGSTIEDLNKNLKKVVQESGFKLDFDKCIADSKIEDFILKDRIDGAKNYKIEATPTLIINGEKFENAKNYKKLKKYIEKLI